MPHCDEETLSLLALGESFGPGQEADARHLATCDDCQGEIEALRVVVDDARAALHDVLQPDQADGRDATEGSPVTPIPPPARVWDAIAAATGVSVHARPEQVTGEVRQLNGVVHH